MLVVPLPKGVNKVAGGERYSANPWEIGYPNPFAPQRGATLLRYAPPLVAYSLGRVSLTRGSRPIVFWGRSPLATLFCPFGYFWL